MKVLLSAYACEPGKGSEPGVGWNLATHLARHHEVWILTRANNRPIIEVELARNPALDLHFVYHDLPAWARFWKKGPRGVQLYYYLWQLTAIPLIRRLQREVGFDILHHITFVKYWAPSVLAFVKDIPFVWGPVGGGDSVPLAFWPTLGARGILYEAVRTLARFLGELDPLVRFTARRATVALATTPETAARMSKLGAKRVEVQGESGLSDSELERLCALPLLTPSPLRFLSIGRLLALKAFHLGVRAFAKAGLQDAEYWIVGDGPERKRLEALARRLGVADRMRFFGQIPREEVLRLLGQVHVLVHPSLHDSGGWVCLEAMAAGRPVVCLNLGGPSVQVTEMTGIKIPARSFSQVINDLAGAMHTLVTDSCHSMRDEGRKRVKEMFSWSARAKQIAELYTEVLGDGK